MKQSQSLTFLLPLLLLGIISTSVSSFTLPSSSATSSPSSIQNVNKEEMTTNDVSRRSFFATALLPAFLLTTTSSPQPSFAADDDEPSVQTPLYFILRVREAAEQETRLIKSGKFKDVQRANVKLAVKFMLENYRLNDNFIGASAYLNGERKYKAADIGQTTVQNLITILEYFDSSGVENIKVGASGLAGKEAIVLNGLASARKGIDDFVSLFPKEDVSAVIAKIEAENELNRQEFDKELGQILNPKPVADKQS